MINWASTLAAIVAVWTVSAAAEATTPIETPWFQKKVATGKLPTVAARLPQSPRIIRLESPGVHGGTMRIVFGRSKDTR
ncbi:MAG: hypothetical protein VX007_04215, partial [Pseudomonadota bacterium]|nr:hypothetical protein [Pseudomonadota bacterium]